jgi:ABC-2 type transport system permease protein
MGSTLTDAFWRTLNLTWKELLTMFKDRRSRFSLVIPPLLQAIIFGYAASYDLKDVPYAICDQDRSAASHELLAGFDGSGAFRRIAEVGNIARLEPLIDHREALMAIQVPADFERRLSRGQAANVQVIVDGRNSATAGAVLSYAGAIATAFSQRWSDAHGGGGGRELNLVTRAWYNPNLITQWQILPSLLGTITLIGITIVTSLSVAREREEGTLDQLLVTPMRPHEVMIGKAVPSLLVGLLQATTLLCAARFWFHIPFAGSYLSLYLALILFLSAAVGIGLLVSAFAATMQQAMLGTFVLVMPFSLLSGMTTPIGNMPQVIQWIVVVNPLRWAIAIVQREFLEGAPFIQLLPLMLPLIVLAIISLSAAVWVYRHRLN